LIRDTTFPGIGPLPTAELLQILGRAGRQDRPGEGTVLLRAEDAWKLDELVTALRDETVPALASAFERSLSRSSRSRIDDVAAVEPLATAISGLLSRSPDDGCRLEDLDAFLRRSLGGVHLAGSLNQGLSWLSDPSRRLVPLPAIRDRKSYAAISREAASSI
jgi:hypothetical protein